MRAELAREQFKKMQLTVASSGALAAPAYIRLVGRVGLY